MEKIRAFMREVAHDLAKQVVTVTVWSSAVAFSHGVYSIIAQETGLKRSCKYTSLWHYHPARMIACKLLKTVDN